MPSKTSKSRKKAASAPQRWKDESSCSESELREIARELAAVLQPGDRVLLEGPMGAGKTTFARALLEALGVHQPPEGSPSFAIVHEYESPRGGVAHMDLYRIKNEMEIEEAGISSYFWERPLIVITEWLSSFPDFREAVLRSSPGHRVWDVRLDFASSDSERRSIEIGFQ